MDCLRMPVCVVVGHVDHGKSSVLDFIRNTSIVNSEPGAITQSIGASIVPLDTINKICGDLLGSTKRGMDIPGLLFIDTPGHAAFTSLRKRGGNIADIAIVVVDINEGFKPQTVEAIEILKSFKTPFIVAANKIDLISGWRQLDKRLLKSISMMHPDLQTKFETKMYELVGKLSELGFNSERFDRVEDFTKEIGIIPVSAKTGEGIPELLYVLIGLTQKYLEETLKCDVSGFAKGTILEVKEEQGLGCCLDVIIYDGHLAQNDTIVIGTLSDPIVTKVRGLFEPAPLNEMRDKKSTFSSVKEVYAASGVRISGPGMENAVSGMPIISCDASRVEEAKEMIKQEVEEALIETDDQGIIVKADSLGTLEALVKMLKEQDIPIRRASIGSISKKDIAEAESNSEKDPLLTVVLGFNVLKEPNLNEGNVKVLTHNIIYALLDDYAAWVKEKQNAIEAQELDTLVRPCKVQIMKGYIFRQSNPAVVGVDVLNGTLKAGMPLMKEGEDITSCKSIQMEKESVSSAVRGKQVAVSLPNVVVGRQIEEDDFLYSAIPEADFRKMKELKKYLTPDEKSAIKEIADIYRKKNQFWGV
jgi:translation initiation factor 5B